MAIHGIVRMGIRRRLPTVPAQGVAGGASGKDDIADLVQAIGGQGGVSCVSPKANEMVQ